MDGEEAMTTVVIKMHRVVNDPVAVAVEVVVAAEVMAARTGELAAAARMRVKTGRKG